jgi:hypothetical protein
MIKDIGARVKSKANTRFIERLAKFPHGRGIGKLSHI